MVKIRWTEESERWLRDIHDYIALGNPTAALNTVEGIYNKAQLLSKFPRIGHRYESIKDREVRILPYGHYRIAYSIKDENSIDILGVFHDALEITRYLF